MDLISTAFPGKDRLIKKMDYSDIVSLYTSIRENPFPLVFDRIKLHRFLPEIMYSKIMSMRSTVCLTHSMTETQDMAVYIYHEILLGVLHGGAGPNDRTKKGSQKGKFDTLREVRAVRPSKDCYVLEPIIMTVACNRI